MELPANYRPKQEHLPVPPNIKAKAVPKFVQPTNEAKNFGYNHAVMLTPDTYVVCCYCGRVSEKTW